MTLEGEVNRFLHRHPNWGALISVGVILGLVVLGGKFADYVAEHPGMLAILIAGAVLTVMALAGNRHLS
jgi:hypothetical protein